MKTKTAAALVAAAALSSTAISHPAHGRLITAAADAKPSMAQLVEMVEESNKVFAAFMEANDERLAQIEAKGQADPLTDEKVNKINAALEEIRGELKDTVEAAQARIDELELVANRIGLGGDGDVQDVVNEARQFMACVRGVAVDDLPTDQVDPEAYSAYRAAFRAYLRRGDKALAADVRNALSVGSDPDGGYWVPATHVNTIIKRLFDTSPVRQYASVTTIGTDAYEQPNDVNDFSEDGWAGETTAPSDTDTPDVGELRIPVHLQQVMPKATQKLLDDTVFDAEAWLIAKIADRLRRVEAAAFVNGTGIRKPRGFMSYSGSAVATVDGSRAWGKLQFVKTGEAGSFATDGSGADELIDLVHAMKQEYRAGAIWCANRLTFAEARKLKDADGNYLWSMGNIAAGQPDRLLGYPTADFDDMDDIATNSFSMAFANLGVGYLIVDRQGIRILRDPFTGKPYIKFYTTRRVGGDVVNFDAIKLLKFAA